MNDRGYLAMTPPSSAKSAAAEELLARGVQAHRAGRLAEAVGLYRRAVERAPRHPGALNLLALALFQAGQASDAAPLLEQAVALNPQLPSGHYNLGRILQSLGRFEEARRHYELALLQQPSDAEIHNNLGVVLRSLELDDQAVVYFLRAVELKPHYGEAHFNLGNALLALRRYQEAAAAFEKAVAFNVALAEAYSKGGRALMELRRYDEALSRFEAALLRDPDNPDDHDIRGYVLQHLGRYAEAKESHEQALALDPTHAEAQLNVGVVLEHFERYDEALHCYERARTLRPDFTQARWNYGYLALSLGRFDIGWPVFGERWTVTETKPRYHPQPSWNGGDVEGTLLVWGEQGLGDQILNASMIEDLRRRARALVVEVEPRLVPLFARSFPDVRFIPLGPELYQGEAAVQVSLSDIGRHLRADWNSFPRRDRGYLTADTARAAELRARLSGDGRRVIGLSWQSVNPQFGAAKTARLHDFASVLRIEGCRFVDLQYGETGAERAAVLRDLGVEVERLNDVDNRNDIDALAALITACDMVVTVSNTTAHLAGALGVPLWVMIPRGTARLWYWFRKRRDSPWYPRAQVRHQAPGESWAELVARITPEIERALA